MYSDNFFEISENANLKSVTTVSELRHYVNIYGITNELLSYFSINENIIGEIIDGCYGYLDIKDLINDTKYRKECIIQRQQKQLSKEETFLGHLERIEELHLLRKEFCTIGTNKIKRRLNKIANDNYIAKLFRIALEIEDKNIQAKEATGLYSDKIYNDKYKLIIELVNEFKKYNLTFGKQDSDLRNISYIIYFELPNCEQISFHTNLNNPEIIPNYLKEWDNKKNATLKKLEQGILINFPQIINLTR
jgi:hypothetical protein